jgi:hypothetical protein
MLPGHLIEFLGEIEPHKQGSWAKARTLADDNRSTGTVNIDRFCAGPNAIGLAMKSVQEFQFSHHSRPSSYFEEPTARINRRGRLGAGPVSYRASTEIKATVRLSRKLFAYFAPDVSQLVSLCHRQRHAILRRMDA